MLTLLWTLAGGLHAQNWALLNPAYKYNFSNDGTDTISNQLFITHTDTLGPDSFRYAINTIVSRCDTCPAGLGGVCDGCFLRLDQSQFMGYSCATNGSNWVLEDSDHVRLIRTDAAIGDQWLYDTLAGTIATLDTNIQVQTYGQADSVQIISLSNGDTIKVSKSFGMLEFTSSGTQMMQVGEQTLNMGITVPSLASFITLQPGDVVQYEGGHGQMAISNWDGEGFIDKMMILSRSDQGDSIIFQVQKTTYHATYIDYGQGPPYFSEYSGSAPSVWTISAHRLPFFGVMNSYPGEVINGSVVYLSYGPEMSIVADHGIDGDGNYQISARRYPYQINPYWWDFQSMFTDGDVVAPGLLAIGPWSINPDPEPSVIYRQGPGVVRYVASFFESGESFVLDGAVIGGDTTGFLTPDSVLIAMGMPDQVAPNAMHIGPVPANERITLFGQAPLTGPWRILSTTGQTMREGAFHGATTAWIDVADLPDGLYILMVGDDVRQFERIVIQH